MTANDYMKTTAPLGYSKCYHAGTDHVWDDLPNIHAGAKAGLRGVTGVLLDCTGPAKIAACFPPIMIGDAPGNERFHSLLSHAIPDPVVIALDWPDGGVPPVAPTFWVELLKLVLANDDKLFVCCMGGHGRTGTALTALRLAWCSTQKGNTETLSTIVDDIRFFHCDSAVETGAQVAYLTRLAAFYGIPAGDPFEGSYVHRYAPQVAAQEAPKTIVDYATALANPTQRPDPLAKAIHSHKKGDVIANRQKGKRGRRPVKDEYSDID